MSHSATDEFKKAASHAMNQGKKMADSAKESMEEGYDEAKSCIQHMACCHGGSIDKATSFLSPSTWIALALGSMVISAVAETKTDKREPGNFFGLWAPCFLLMGVFSKIQSGKNR